MKLFASKLEGDLKAFVAIYSLLFCLNWLLTVPMLVHVHSRNECWLFISPRMEYGPNSVCHLIGYGSLVLGIINVVLLIAFMSQLAKFKKRKKQPRQNRSKDFIEKIINFFGHLIKLHLLGNVLILIIVAVITTGFATTCQHLQREVGIFVRKRHSNIQYGYQDKKEKVERFEDESSYRKYTNGYGGEDYAPQISCRKVLLDPVNHLKIKRNQDTNQRVIYGVYDGSDEYTDRGSLATDTYRGNATLEISIAGAWIIFVIWTGLFIFMFVKRRLYLKSRHTNTSFFGSEFGSHASSYRSKSKASTRYGPRSECNSYHSAVSPSMVGYEEESVKMSRQPEISSIFNQFEPSPQLDKTDLDNSLMNETDINGYLAEHILDEELNSSIMGQDLPGSEARRNIPTIVLEDYQSGTTTVYKDPNRAKGRRNERAMNTTRQTVVL